MGAIIRSQIPYVGSCGALDMVNFEAIDTVPQKFKNRNLYQHNPQVTLMRTTAAENQEIGRFIAGKLNQMEGPVRFLLPLKGVSLIDASASPSTTRRPTKCCSKPWKGNFDRGRIAG